MNFVQIKDKYKKIMEELDFFDVNCWVSVPSDQQLSKDIKIDEILDKMKRNSIKKAVFSNARCKMIDPLIANAELIDIIAQYENIYAAGCIVPEIVFQNGGAEIYLKSLIKQGIVVLRAFPRQHSYSLSDWCMGEIFGAMERYRLPLMLWHTETEFDTIAQLCSKYPEMPIILEGNDKKLIYHNRSFVPLLQHCKNLYIETHNFVQYLGFEYLVNGLKIDRLVFGSFAPYNDFGASLGALGLSDISIDSKRNIAYKNLESLVMNIKKT